VFQVTGYRTGSPVVQTAQREATETASVIAIVFGSALGTNNAYIIAAQHNNDNALNSTPPAGWTETVDGGYGTPTTGVTAAYRATGETGTSYSFDVDDFTTQEVFAVGIEIAAPATNAQAVGGALTFSGAVTKKTRKALAGTLKLFGTFSLLHRLLFRLTAPWRKTSLTAQQADTTLTAPMWKTSLTAQQTDTTLTAPMTDTDLRGEHE
jgi:hypothetical protein